MDRIIEIEAVEYQALDETSWAIRPMLIPRYGDDFELCRYSLKDNGKSFEIDVLFTDTYLSTRGVRPAIQEEIDQGYQRSIEDLKNLAETTGLDQVKKVIDNYRNMLGEKLSIHIFKVGKAATARLFKKTNGTWEVI